MSVHYKFKTCLGYDKVTFDGVHISVADLKKAIIQQKKIGKSADFDLQITNQQTKEVYETDDTLIPKNTTVIVARVPVDGGKKHRERNEPNNSVNTSNAAHVNIDKVLKSNDLANSEASEEEKIKQMVTQSTQDYDSSKFVKTRGMIGPLPPNYTCYRCGQPGHYIKHCPTNNMDIKRSTGIPRSFMIPASADQKGALLTASGEYAVPIIDHEAYKEVKKDKHPFMTNDTDAKITEPGIPEDIQCLLCNDLLTDAVMIPCCGNSYCDECIRTNLLESEQHQCPTCSEIGISPNMLIPNRFLRTAVMKFKNETGYTSKDRKEKVNSKVDTLINKPMVISGNGDVIEEKAETENDVDMKEQVNDTDKSCENKTNSDTKSLDESETSLIDKNHINEKDDLLGDNTLSLDEVLVTNKIDDLKNVDILNENVKEDDLDDDDLNLIDDTINNNNNVNNNDDDKKIEMGDNDINLANKDFSSVNIDTIENNKDNLGSDLVKENNDCRNGEVGVTEKLAASDLKNNSDVSTVTTANSSVTNSTANSIATLPNTVASLSSDGVDLLHEHPFDFQHNNLLVHNLKPPMMPIRNLIRPISSLVSQNLPIHRGPILQHPPPPHPAPRGMYSQRPSLAPDPRFYRTPMRDHQNYNMSMAPSPYGYGAPSMRPQYTDVYMMNRAPNNIHSNQFPRQHMSNYPSNYNEPAGTLDCFDAKDNNVFLGSALNMPPDGYNHYMNSMHEYEDPLDQFVKHLQTQRHNRHRSRSRSRSNSRRRSRSRIRSRRSRSRVRSRRSRSRSSRSRTRSKSIGKNDLANREKKLSSQQLERTRERSRSKQRYKERVKERERDFEKDIREKDRKSDRHRHQHKSRRDSKEKIEPKSRRERKDSTDEEARKKHKHHKEHKHSSDSKSKKSKKNSGKEKEKDKEKDNKEKDKEREKDNKEKNKDESKTTTTKSKEIKEENKIKSTASVSSSTSLKKR